MQMESNPRLMTQEKHGITPRALQSEGCGRGNGF